VGVVASVLIGIGVGVMSMSPPEFQISKACFSVAALLILVKFGLWVVTIQSSVWERGIIALLVFGLIGVGWAESIRWVQSREPNTAGAQIYKQTYVRFMTEKNRRIASYERGGFLSLKINALIGQQKTPGLRDNPGLNAEIAKTVNQYEQWIQENSKSEADFDGMIAEIRTAFPPSQNLSEMLDAVEKPYRVHIEDPPPLDLEAEKIWLKKSSDRLNRELDESVKQPLNTLALYLRSKVDRTDISVPFSVEIVKWSGGAPINQGGVGFWVGQEGVGGRVVSHADLAVFLQVVNLQPFVSQLSSYSIEVKTKGTWRKTTKMNVLSVPAVFFVPPDRDFRNAEQIKLDTFFDSAVLNRTVQSHEPIRGWVLLQYEDGPDLSHAPEQFRVSLSDAAGVLFRTDALTSSGPQRNEDAQFAIIIPKGNKAVDLSRYKVMRWSENLIAPLSPPPTTRDP